MSVPLWIWAITFVVVIGFFTFDFVSHVRTPHEPSMKEASGWIGFYVAIAAIFGVIVWATWGSNHGMQFFTGYITELSLSIDNLFVFALIMGSFKIPRRYQQKVLLIGIMLALVFRLVFILLGAAIIEAWSDIFYLFAAFLLYTAIKLFWDEASGAEQTDPNDMATIKFLRKVVPVSSRYHRDKLTVRENGKFTLTPLFVALAAIGMIDVMFAFDSIPAIYGITDQAYIVFTTNAFALMGLRQMYFLLDGLLERLVYLPYGLSIILGFIGVKLGLHALHENKLPFINGGHGVHVPEIGTTLSLGVIVGVLALTVIASIIKAQRTDNEGGVAEGPKTDYDDFGIKHPIDEDGYMTDDEGNELDWDGDKLAHRGDDPSAGHLH